MQFLLVQNAIVAMAILVFFCDDKPGQAKHVLKYDDDMFVAS